MDKGKGVATTATTPGRFSIFNFPDSVLSSLALSPVHNNRLLHTTVNDTAPSDDVVLALLGSARIAQPTCHTCGGEVFDGPEEQRKHFKSAWHQRNLARKIEWSRKRSPEDTAVSADGEYPWNPLKKDDDDIGIDDGGVEESEDDSDSDSDDVPVVARKKANGYSSSGSKLSDALLWFSSTADDDSTVYGVHRRILVPKGVHGVHIDANEVLAELKRLQQPVMPQRTQAELKQQKKLGSQMQGPSTTSSQKLWAFVALNGGYFAGAIIDTLTGDLVAHKTFVRYTTRRKQGGSQSRQDNAMGFAANSAGAQIRRYNEQKLQEEIHALMAEWRPWLDACDRVLVRVPRTNRKDFFGPAAESPLRWSDPRIREVPVPMARPSLAELKRVYAEVTTVSVKKVTVRPPVAEEAASIDSIDLVDDVVVVDDPGSASDSTLEPEPRPDLLAFLHHVAKMIQNPALSDDDIVAYLCEHLEQFLDALSDPAMGLRYLTTTDTVQAFRTPTLLHVASQFGRFSLIPFLLDNGEDPTVTSGHPPMFTGG
ncbi:hypothetical protein GGI21_003362, partial [Coemansia aciculifera]